MTDQQSTSLPTKMETDDEPNLKIHESPICLVVLGMAGSGKTTFVKKLTQFNYDEHKPYVLNLDPACKEVPYHANIGESHNLFIKNLFNFCIFRYSRHSQLQRSHETIQIGTKWWYCNSS